MNLTEDPDHSQASRCVSHGSAAQNAEPGPHLCPPHPSSVATTRESLPCTPRNRTTSRTAGRAGPATAGPTSTQSDSTAGRARSARRPAVLRDSWHSLPRRGSETQAKRAKPANRLLHECVLRLFVLRQVRHGKPQVRPGVVPRNANDRLFVDEKLRRFFAVGEGAIA